MSRLLVHSLAEQARASPNGKEDQFMTRPLTCLNFYQQSLTLAVAIVIAFTQNAFSQDVPIDRPLAFVPIHVSELEDLEKDAFKGRSECLN